MSDTVFVSGNNNARSCPLRNLQIIRCLIIYQCDTIMVPGDIDILGYFGNPDRIPLNSF